MSSLPIKSAKIKEYMKFKEKITATAFIDLLKELPNSDFNEPHPGQNEVIRAYDERIPPSLACREEGLTFEYRYRILTVAAGRRWGKSVISAVLGLQELLIPNAKVMIVSHELSNCEVIFKKIYKMLQALGIGMTIERIQKMELELENGSSLRVASSDNAQGKLGSSISLLIIDEAKLVSRTLYQEVLAPMLFDYSPYSRTILISSPAPGWFETYYNYGQSGDPVYQDCWSINSPTSMNPTIPKAELERWEKTMPVDIYRTEVLGLFTSTEGRVFSEFDRVVNVFDINDYPHFGAWLQGGNIIVNSVDSGFKHFFAGTWFVWVEEVDTIFVFEEYNLNGTTTDVHAANIKELENKWNIEPDMRFADPAAAQQICDFQLLDLYYMKADKNTRETINQVNSLFFQRSGVTGLPKLLISKDCTETIRQVTEVAWKVGRDELTKEQATSGTKPFQPDRSGAKTDFDLVDSFRYGIWSFIKNNMGGGISVFSFGEDSASEEDAFTSVMNKAGMFRMG